MQTILLVLHVAMGLALIAVILLQQGTGATAGAAFGSGASSTVFGARGSASFLTRVTGILALVFFANSFLLAYLAKGQLVPKSIVEQSLGDIPVMMDDALPENLTMPADVTTIIPDADAPPVPNGNATKVDDLPAIPTQ
jgi:preprotein translocase subunit SecG